jgi:hypothetical protein
MSITALTYQAIYDRLIAHISSPTDAQKAEINLRIEEAVLRFLVDHDWSFATKAATVAIDADNDGIDSLPTDFESVSQDPVLVAANTYGPPSRLTRRTQEWILERVQASQSVTGQPTDYAIRPADYVDTVGQRWELLTYPLPDADYSLIVSYRPTFSINVSATTGYPPGGQTHALTILAAVFAAWEREKGETDGAYERTYLSRLAASIARDTTAEGRILGATPNESEHIRRIGNVTYESGA